MKVLQTLGRRGSQHGIFQYRRGPNGIIIDMSIGTAPTSPESEIRITNKEWTAILRAIKGEKGILKMTSTSKGKGTSLHQLIKDAVKTPTKFKTWTSSYLAYVCSILEHEGSIVFYAGSAGNGTGVSMHFAQTKRRKPKTENS